MNNIVHFFCLIKRNEPKKNQEKTNCSARFFLPRAHDRFEKEIYQLLCEHLSLVCWQPN
jgi:hypothetical protein